MHDIFITYINIEAKTRTHTLIVRSLLQGQGSAASDYAHQKKKKMHVVSHANYFLDFIK